MFPRGAQGINVHPNVLAALSTEARKWRPDSTCVVAAGSIEAQVGSGRSLRNLSQKGSGVFRSCDLLDCVFLHPCGLGQFGFCCGFVPPSTPRKQNETLPVHGP